MEEHMKALPLIFFFFLASNLQAAEICYFSLDNSEASLKLRKQMIKKLNKVSQGELDVFEYQVKNDEKAENAFKKMMDSGQKCDGLVIHQKNSFEAWKPKLSADSLEEMSCNPQYKDFFGKIKSLWVFGEKINKHQNHHHTLTSLTNIEIRNTLEKSPIPNRYLTIFPNASLFGQTRNSPIIRAINAYSLFYHFAHMRKMDTYFNSSEQSVTNKTSIKYFNTLLSFLQRTPYSEPKCYHHQLALQSWIFTGKSISDEYGNTIPEVDPIHTENISANDTVAYSSLNSSGNPLHELASELRCDLKKKHNSSIQLATILEKILQDEYLIGYNFNGLMEVAKKRGAQWVRLKNQMKSNSTLWNFIEKNLGNPNIELLQKIEYYVFLKNLGIPKASTLRIENALFKSIFKTLIQKSINTSTKRHALMWSLMKHGMLKHEHYTHLIEQAENYDVLQIIAWQIQEYQHPIKNEDKILMQIVNSDKANAGTLSTIANTILAPNHPIKNADKLLLEIVKSDKANFLAFDGVIDTLREAKFPIANKSQILEEIVNSDKANAGTLSTIANIFLAPNHPIKNADKVLLEIVKSDKVNRRTLEGVIDTLREAKFPIANKSQILEEIVNSDKANAGTLSTIANIFLAPNHPIKNADKVLLEIVKSDKVNRRTLEGVIDTLREAKFPIANKSQIFEEIINSDKVDEQILSEINEAFDMNSNRKSKK